MPQLRHGEGEAEHQALRGVRVSAELSLLVLAVEVVGVLLSRSLSLTVDAVHDLPDLLALALSWYALEGTREGSSPEFTFGTHRTEVLAGILNGVLVLGAGVGFGYLALGSWLSGVPFAGPVQPLWLIAAALPTLALRLISLWVIERVPTRVRDLNLRSVFVHLASDLAITGALLTVGLGLLLRPGWTSLDDAAALFIGALLIYEAYPLLRDGWEVLAERTPKGISVEAIRRAALEVPGVSEVHDVHVWAVCSSLVCMTAHVSVSDRSLREGMQVVRSLRERMEKEFGILHATFELEATGA